MTTDEGGPPVDAGRRVFSPVSGSGNALAPALLIRAQNGGTPLVFRAGVAESSGRTSVVAGTIALRDAPDRPLVAARGISVKRRPVVVEAYVGSIPDSAGAHTPPRRPGDAGALDRG